MLCKCQVMERTIWKSSCVHIVQLIIIMSRNGEKIINYTKLNYLDLIKMFLHNFMHTLHSVINIF